MRRLLTYIAATMCFFALQGKTTAHDAVGKMSAELKRVLASCERNNQGSDAVRVMLWLNDENAANELASEGCRVVAQCGSMCTLLVPADRVKIVCQQPQVKLAEAPRRMHLHNDRARSLTGVDQILQGEGLPEKYDGNGVVIGVVDAGIDFGHLAFRDEHGNSRVSRVYMPCRAGVADVYAGDMLLPGTEYLGDEILGVMTEDTLQSHGTHTSCIAAGSMVNSYGGMAPGAELVLCDIPTDSLSNEVVIYSAWYIASYAQSVGKPCVINLSLGNHDGPHDGTGMLPRALDEVSKTTGAIIVASAGNEGANNLYIHKEFAENDTVCYTFLAAVNGTIDTQVDAWSGDDSPLSVCYTLYDRNMTVLSKTDWISADTLLDYSAQSLRASGLTGKIDVKFAVNEVTGKREVLAKPMLKMSGLYLQLGYKGKASSRMNVWSCDGQDLRSFGLDSCMDGSPACSISDMATGKNIISVGSYVSRTSYPLLDGSERPLGGVYGHRSYYSSYGVDMCGNLQPLVLAPGQSLVSALNRYQYGLSRNVIAAEMIDDAGVPNWWGVKSGTSMSAPVVTGIIALWLQAAPSLTPADVQRIIRATAERDLYVEMEPERCGAGKINALEGLKSVLSTGLAPMKADGNQFEMSFRNGNLEINALPMTRTVQLTVNTVQGACVFERELNVSGGHAVLGLNGLASGVYVVAARTSDRIKTLKIVVR